MGETGNLTREVILTWSLTLLYSGKGDSVLTMDPDNDLRLRLFVG